MNKKLLNKILGQNIRQLRQQRKLTIEDLADYIDISSSFLGLIERGERGLGLLNIIKLSELFNCKVDDLINNIPKLYENETDLNKV